MSVAESSALLTRIATLEDSLRHARYCVTDKSVDLDARLRERIRVRIGFLIDQELTALKTLRAGLDGNAAARPEQWGRFSVIRSACRPLFRECLALIEGTSTRRAGMDRGLCAIADALLDDLSHRSDIPWGRFTILDTGESFGEMAEIIRLRFPQTTLWDLPVVAHEFGHFLAPRIRRRGSGRNGSPFQERLTTIDDSQERVFLHENFADVAATVALGLAWALTELLLRLDPFDCRDDDARRDPRSRHPPDADRAQLILATLRAVDDPMSEGPYSKIADELADGWTAARRAAGCKDGGDDAPAAREAAADLLGMIAETLPGDLRFGPEQWLQTEELATNLADPAKAPEANDEVTLQHVLNAAWRARRMGVESLFQLEQDSVALCKEAAATVEPVAGSS